MYFSAFDLDLRQSRQCNRSEIGRRRKYTHEEAFVVRVDAGCNGVSFPACDDPNWTTWAFTERHNNVFCRRARTLCSAFHIISFHTRDIVVHLTLYPFIVVTAKRREDSRKPDILRTLVKHFHAIAMVMVASLSINFLT